MIDELGRKVEITESNGVMQMKIYDPQCPEWFPYMIQWCAVGRFTPWPVPKFTGKLPELRNRLSYLSDNDNFAVD